MKIIVTSPARAWELPKADDVLIVTRHTHAKALQGIMVFSIEEDGERLHHLENDVLQALRHGAHLGMNDPRYNETAGAAYEAVATAMAGSGPDFHSIVIDASQDDDSEGNPLEGYPEGTILVTEKTDLGTLANMVNGGQIHIHQSPEWLALQRPLVSAVLKATRKWRLDMEERHSLMKEDIEYEQQPEKVLRDVLGRNGKMLSTHVPLEDRLTIIVAHPDHMHSLQLDRPDALVISTRASATGTLKLLEQCRSAVNVEIEDADGLSYKVRMRLLELLAPSIEKHKAAAQAVSAVENTLKGIQ